MYMGCAVTSLDKAVCGQVLKITVRGNKKWVIREYDVRSRVLETNCYQTDNLVLC